MITFDSHLKTSLNMFKLFTVANESVLNVDVTLVILFRSVGIFLYFGNNIELIITMIIIIIIIIIITTTTMNFTENKSILLHLIVNSSTKVNY